MFTNDIYNDENKFILSHELLALLIWILENEEKALAALIKKAVNAGLKHEIAYNTPLHNEELIMEAQNTVIDFFSLMEAHLAETLHERSIKKATVRNLLPALDQLDAKNFDSETVRMCIAKATNLPKDSKKTAKEALCKELLKNWNPQKNPEIN